LQVKDQITVESYGRRLSKWTSASVTASLESGARTFSLAFSAPEGEAPPVLPVGSPVKVYVDGTLALTGWVDAVNFSGDANSLNWTATGRSKTEDLVDCAAGVEGPSRWNKAKVERIARDVAKPFGVDVVRRSAEGEPFEKFRLKKAETAFSAIVRAAGRRGLWVTDDPLGRLVLARAAEGTADTPIVVGGNVISSSLALNVAGLFSEYIVRGQSVGTDNAFGTQVSDVVGKVGGPAPRFRPTVFQGSGRGGGASKKQQAQRAADEFAAQSLSLTYVVPGWRQREGGLWEPNQVAWVFDPRVHLDDTMLIASVTWAVGATSGPTSTLTLKPVRAFAKFADAVKRASKCPPPPDSAYWKWRPDGPEQLDFYPVGTKTWCEFRDSKWKRVKSPAKGARRDFAGESPDPDGANGLPMTPGSST